MPKYRITDPQTGRSAVVSGDSPPSEQEVQDIFASVPATQAPPAATQPPSAPVRQQAAPSQPPRTMPSAYGVPMMLGGLPIDLSSPESRQRGQEMMSRVGPLGTAGLSVPVEQGQKALPYMARFGPAIAAGFMAGPGASMATYSALGAAGMGAGELAGQGAEMLYGNREGIDAGAVGGAAVRGAVPVVRAGGPIARFLSNATTGAGMETAARFVEGGAADRSDILTAAGLTGVLGYAAGRTKRAIDFAEKAEEIGASRRSPAGVILSDVDPSFSRIEAGMAGKSKLFNDIVEAMDGGIAQFVQRWFPDEVSSAAVATDLAQLRDKIDPLTKGVQRAKNNLELAQKAVIDAEAAGAVAMPAIRRNAEQAALDLAKANAIRESAVMRELVGVADPMAAGARMDRVQELVNAADDVAKSQVDNLYNDIVGVTQSTPIVSIKDIRPLLRRIDGDDARKKAESLIQSFFGGQETITLERFRRMRNEISNNLANDNQFRDTANKFASDIYGIVSDASMRFIRREYPDLAKPWITAQRAAANNFKTRSAGVIEEMRKGNSEGVLQKINEEGVGPSLRAVNEYADFLGNTYLRGDPNAQMLAKEAKKAFLQDFYGVVRDGLLDQAMNRGSGVRGPIDPRKLATSLAALASKSGKRGERFPIESLGFGSRREIDALARLATTRGEAGYSIDEIGKFLQEVKAVGISAASARLYYDRELTRLMLEGGMEKINAQTSRLRQLQNVARMNADDAQRALDTALSDPLVKMLNDTRMRLSPDVASNAKYIDRLMAVDPGTVKTFMEALRNTGRIAQVQQLRKAAAASVMRTMLKIEPGGKPKLDLGTAHKLLKGTDGAMTRNNLQAILGDDAYRNLMKNWGTPIAEATQSLDRVAKAKGVDLTDMLGKTSAYAGVGNFRVRENIGTIASWVEGQYYSLLWHALVDPKWAPKLKAVNYNLNAFSEAQATNGIALQLWLAEDEEAKAGGR